MKNVYDVLRQKEVEMAKLQQEVDALHVAVPLLIDSEADNYHESGDTSVAPPLKNSKVDIAQKDESRTPWGEKAKHWLSR